MKKFILINEEARANVLHIINNTILDGNTTIEVKKTTSLRSLAQNNLYRMWVTIIAEEVGHTHNEIHELLSEKYLPVEATEVLGQVVEVRKSTTQLLVGEFSTFLSHVESFAAYYDIKLPQPADQYDFAIKTPH